MATARIGLLALAGGHSDWPGVCFLLALWLAPCGFALALVGRWPARLALAGALSWGALVVASVPGSPLRMASWSGLPGSELLVYGLAASAPCAAALLAPRCRRAFHFEA